MLAPADGVLTQLDALKVGVAAWRLGAGRARKEDPVQAGAGVVMHDKPGATVRPGEKLLTLHTDTPERFERALESLDGAFTIASRGLASRPAAAGHREDLLTRSAAVAAKAATRSTTVGVPHHPAVTQAIGSHQARVVPRVGDRARRRRTAPPRRHGRGPRAGAAATGAAPPW